MNSTARRIISIAAFLAFVVMLVPTSSAEQVGGAASFAATGPTALNGQLSMLDIRLTEGMDLDGKAASMFGYHYTHGSVQAWDIRFEDPRNCDLSTVVEQIGQALGCTQIEDIGSPEAPLRNVRLNVTELAQPNYFRIIPWGHGAFMSANHSLLDGISADQVYFRGGFSPDEPENAESGIGPETNEEPLRKNPRFTTRVVDDAVLIQARGNSHVIHLTGDFVLELRGAAVGVRTPSEYTEYRTDNTTSGDEVKEGVQQFLRLFITDAKMTLRLDHGKVASAAPGVSLSSDNADLVIGGATGFDFLPRSDGGGRLVPAPYAVDMAAADDGRMGVNVVDYHRAAPTASIMAGLEMTPTMWSIISSLAAVGIGAYVIRAMTVPPLPKVEAALQSGSYRKAARLSTRILRANPRQESAHLSRAIAWSRAGQNNRIVRHVEPFLRRHEPSDGTIHYVLGLAYLDLGREGDARTMMEEAVTRTPSLLAEVSPSLRTTRHEGDAYT